MSWADLARICRDTTSAYFKSTINLCYSPHSPDVDCLWLKFWLGVMVQKSSCGFPNELSLTPYTMELLWWLQSLSSLFIPTVHLLKWPLSGFMSPMMSQIWQQCSMFCYAAHDNVLWLMYQCHFSSFEMSDYPPPRCVWLPSNWN